MMKIELEQEKQYRAFAVQLMDYEEAIIVRRGNYELKISGEDAGEVLERLISCALEKDMTKSEMLNLFMAEYQDVVGEMIDLLIEKNILVEADNINSDERQNESSLEIFYWNFGIDAKVVTERLNSANLVIVGVNEISRQLVTRLRETGVENLTVVDDPIGRNFGFFGQQNQLDHVAWPDSLPVPQDYETWGSEVDPSQIGCLVVTSDHGGQQFIRDWNQQCIDSGVTLFPIILRNLIGFIGPYVVPGESACFECFRARQNSHIEDPAEVRASELYAFEGQKLNGYHPSMTAILGEYGAFELTKIFGRGISRYRVGTVVRVNMILPQVSSHKVLKLPRCPVCSSLNSRSAETPSKTTFMPGHRIEE
jgi:bacteriocin biosynthesis cyclodehydratase domain-containing protein